jgi:CRP/FNR family transcriptional regulator, cyclic AMP receptor protein
MTAAHAADDPRLLERYGRRFAAGEVVFRAGDPAETAYLLREGRVRLIQHVGTQDRGLRVVRPGELFGEVGLVPGAERSATAVALLESTALELRAEAFEELLAADPGVGLRLIQQISRRLRDAEHQIGTLVLRDAQLKIVVSLIQLAQQQASTEAPEEAFALAISPLELSARVGLDVDTVKRNVQQLRANGYVAIVDERVQIPDLSALRELRGLLEIKDTIAGPGAAPAGRTAGESLAP